MVFIVSLGQIFSISSKMGRRAIYSLRFYFVPSNIYMMPHYLNFLNKVVHHVVSCTRLNETKQNLDDIP